MIVNKSEKLERIKGGGFFMLLKQALAAFGWDTQLGAQYDPSQLSTLFVDEAGTTQVTADGDPVFLGLDLSPNEIPFKAPTSSARPVYRFVNDIHYLEFLSSGEITIDFGAPFRGMMIVGTLTGSYAVEVSVSNIYTWEQPFMASSEIVGIYFVEGMTFEEANEVLTYLEENSGATLGFDPARTDYNYVFRGNNVTTVPDDLFATATGATTAVMAFYQSKLEEIPVGLLDNMTEVEDVRYFFAYNNLTSIPAGLLANNTKLTDIGSMFMNNTITSIPADLFLNTPNITDAKSAFRGNNISEIPSGLIDNFTNVTDFDYMFFTNNITTIPETLFDNLPQATRISGMFSSNPLQSIPVGLFSNTPNVFHMYSAFKETAITEIPLGLFDPIVVDLSLRDAFYRTDLTSIPAGLFDNVTVSSFDQTFGWCESLTTIPPNLFDTQTICSNYDDVFVSCSALTQESVDNALVSIAYSATQNNIQNGVAGVRGTNMTAPGPDGEAAKTDLENLGWTVTTE